MANTHSTFIYLFFSETKVGTVIGMCNLKVSMLLKPYIIMWDKLKSCVIYTEFNHITFTFKTFSEPDRKKIRNFSLYKNFASHSC